MQKISNKTPNNFEPFKNQEYKATIFLFHLFRLLVKGNYVGCIIFQILIYSSCISDVISGIASLLYLFDGYLDLHFYFNVEMEMGEM